MGKVLAKAPYQLARLRIESEKQTRSLRATGHNHNIILIGQRRTGKTPLRGSGAVFLLQVGLPL